MKFSILMPTYNDCDTISASIKSLLDQNYENYELIIIDDGSTDRTKEVVAPFLKNDRIKYIYEENSDQLNALINGARYISGDYVYVLHSDDMMNLGVLKKANEFLNNNQKLDAIIADITLMDNNEKIYSVQRCRKYVQKEYILPLQLLWLGRNLYVDTAFFKKDIFLTNIYTNYLTWNMPFWINYQTKPSILNVKKVDFSFFKYRVFEQNYINNNLGKNCVINGEIRVLLYLLNYYYLPFYFIQYTLYRLLNKMKINYIPFYLKKETKNKYNILLFTLKKRFSMAEIKENPYLFSLLLFFKNNNSRTVILSSSLLSTDIYKGCDMRHFNKLLLSNKLPELYYYIFKEMQIGFTQIEVFNENDYNKAKMLMKFLSIDPYVSVIIKKESD